MNRMSEYILINNFKKVVSDIEFRNNEIVVKWLPDEGASSVDIAVCCLSNEYFTMFSKNDEVLKVLQDEINNKAKYFYCVFVKNKNGKALFMVSWKWNKTLNALLLLPAYLNFKIKNFG